MRDLLGREAAHLAQRQRHLSVRRQGGMTAREDQPQPVILDALIVPHGSLRDVGLEPLGDPRQRLVESRPPAHAIDGLETPRRHQPRPRVRRHAVPWPLLHGRSKGILQRLLGQVEVAEQADQGGEDPA